MYNTYRFVTKLWQPGSEEAGKKFFFNHPHIHIAYSQCTVDSNLKAPKRVSQICSQGIASSNLLCVESESVGFGQIRLLDE